MKSPLNEDIPILSIKNQTTSPRIYLSFILFSITLSALTYHMCYYFIICFYHLLMGDPCGQALWKYMLLLKKKAGSRYKYILYKTFFLYVKYLSHIIFKKVTYPLLRERERESAHMSRGKGRGRGSRNIQQTPC